MKLLGSAPNQLSEFYYQELLALLQSSVGQGDYGGGSLVNSTALAGLQKQSLNFASLSVPSAGQLALGDSLNTPINLLQAQYSAIEQEAAAFIARLNTQLSLLKKSSSLIEFLIGSAQQDSYAQKQAQLTDATVFSGNLAISRGEVPSTFVVPFSDPTNAGIQYSPTSNGVQNVSLVASPILGGIAAVDAGITSKNSITKIPVAGLEWQYSSNGEDEVLFGSDWAQLTLLEPKKNILIGAPSIVQIVPQYTDYTSSWNNYLGIVPNNPANLSVYVQIVMLPRRRQLALTLSGPTFLSNGLLLDNLIVYNNTTAFFNGTDFEIDTNGNLVPITLTGQTVQVFFSENYPAFICSVNQKSWSTPVMLDQDRPYPDGSTVFPPLDIRDGLFPITDELGNPLGLFLQVLTLPIQELLIRIDPTVNTVGTTAQLIVDFDHPSFMNGISLAPFTNFPFYLTSIQVEGLTSDVYQTVFDGGTSGKLLIDRQCSIRFPRTLVRKAYLSFSQLNYTLKQHTIDPVDQLYRDSMVTLQAVLPFTAQEITPSLSRTAVGNQYEFGVKHLVGQDWSTLVSPTNPGIFITGPFQVKGRPEVIRLDCSLILFDSSSISVYLMSQEFATDGTSHSLVSTSIAPGTSIVYSPVGSNIDHVMFYLKFVIHKDYSIVKKYLLQVTNV